MTTTGAVYLLTYHGTLLCVAQGGRLEHQPLADTAAVPVTLPADIAPQRFEDFLVGDDAPLSVPITAGPLADFTATLAGNRRTLTLQRNGTFVSAERGGAHVAHDRIKALDWETFIPLRHHDLMLLRGFKTNRWVVRSTAMIAAPGSANFGPGFKLHLGGISVDLRYQLPFENRALPYRVRLLRDGWRIDEACLLRPLVVMTAFRIPAVHEQMLLSLRSLREIAGYQGHVLVLTDIPPHDLQKRLRETDAHRTTVIPLSARDVVASVASRYALLDWPDINRFQPILCVDPDIIFDGDIIPMLAAIAASDRIAAPVERQSLLRTFPAFGSSLLQQDGARPNLAAGFSTAAFGIPNILDHRDTLTQIRRIIVNRSDRFGRNEPDWLEQEVANYVAYKLGSVDTHLISSFLRVVEPAAAQQAIIGQGLLRLAGPRGSETLTDAMRTALKALGEASIAPGAVAPSVETVGDIKGPAL